MTRSIYSPLKANPWRAQYRFSESKSITLNIEILSKKFYDALNIDTLSKHIHDALTIEILSKQIDDALKIEILSKQIDDALNIETVSEQIDDALNIESMMRSLHLLANNAIVAFFLLSQSFQIYDALIFFVGQHYSCIF